MRFMQTESLLQTKNRSGPAKSRFSVALVDGVINFVDYPFSMKFWAGGKINRPGQLSPHPCL